MTVLLSTADRIFDPLGLLERFDEQLNELEGGLVVVAISAVAAPLDRGEQLVEDDAVEVIGERSRVRRIVEAELSERDSSEKFRGTIADPNKIQNNSPQFKYAKSSPTKGSQVPRVATSKK